MDTLAQYIQTLTPQLSAWRRDFHHFAESGWVEFRTAAKVAEILNSLGYELAMGRDVVDAESRMGLPDDATLSREFDRARAQGAPEKWLAPFEGIHRHRRYPEYRPSRPDPGLSRGHGRA